MGMSKLFFRLESATGQGVYHAIADDSVFNRFGFSTSDCPRHPLPSNDSKLAAMCEAEGIISSSINFNSGYRFGFSSFKQFRSWFYSDELLHKLGELGIILNVYCIPNSYPPAYMDGNTQAIIGCDFHCEEYMIASISLSELF